MSKPVAPPNTSPTPADDAAELEALIEEARQRARRRRRRYVTAFALAGVIAAGVYFGFLRGGEATRSSFEAPESPASGGAIQSGVVEGSFDMGMTALNGGGSQRISFRGPFTTRSPDRLPEFNLSFRMMEGPGRLLNLRPVKFSLISTGESGYFAIRGRAYQVDPARFERLRSAPVLAELDPAAWMSSAKANATESVAGGKTGPKSGRLDVDRMVSDVTRAVKDLGIRPGRVAFPASFFDKRAIDLATTRSGLLRQLAITLTWNGRSEDTERFKAAMHTRLRIIQLNTPQRIVAPAKAAPISTDLTRRIPPQLWGLVEFLSTP